jgi:CelD/BcsL family acetyltransferase involved in cellulose biosynthesis
MSYTINVESLDSISSYWQERRQFLKWGPIFVLPAWLRVWWEAFGGGGELYLRTVQQAGRIIGFAPLLVNKETASFMGSADVCDYLDFVVIGERESDFFNVLLDDLRENGVKKLDLGPLRPDSTVLSQLIGIAQKRGYEATCRHEDVALELDLPPTWDEYLAILNNKQRHEIRRKLRRLSEAGNVEHHCVEAGREVKDYLDTFLQLFSLSRDEKASFMNPKMKSFFRSLAKAMAEMGLLRLGILRLDKLTAAMTMSFDYDGWHYLYNSAYDPQVSYLSVGLLCKVLCLKDSIEKGRKKWSFLKGGEPYKYQLGGQEVPLYNCQITMA